MSSNEHDGEGATGGRRDGAGLPRDVQEHLGRRLRTQLRIEVDAPTFLGESSVPPQFEPLVRRLEAGERGERQGYEAVKRALIDDPAQALRLSRREPD